MQDIRAGILKYHVINVENAKGPINAMCDLWLHLEIKGKQKFDNTKKQQKHLQGTLLRSWEKMKYTLDNMTG